MFVQSNNSKKRSTTGNKSFGENSDFKLMPRNITITPTEWNVILLRFPTHLYRVG